MAEEGFAEGEDERGAVEAGGPLNPLAAPPGKEGAGQGALTCGVLGWAWVEGSPATSCPRSPSNGDPFSVAHL